MRQIKVSKPDGSVRYMPNNYQNKQALESMSRHGKENMKCEIVEGENGSETVIGEPFIQTKAMAKQAQTNEQLTDLDNENVLLRKQIAELRKQNSELEKNNSALKTNK